MDTTSWIYKKYLIIFFISSWICLPYISADAMSYSQIVLADNPVGYWRMGEISGTTLVDSSTSANHGTYSGVALNQPGIYSGNSSALFDGTNDYGVVPDSNAYNFLDYTLEAWVKINGSASADRRIISQQDTNYWLLHIKENRLSLYSSLDDLHGPVYGPDLNDGQWHHVAVTRDTANDVYKAWVDGVMVGYAITTNNTAYSISNNVYIGSYRGTLQFLPGYIDEIAVYNRALSTVEIQEHYNGYVVPEPISIFLMGIAFCFILCKAKYNNKLRIK